MSQTNPPADAPQNNELTAEQANNLITIRNNFTGKQESRLNELEEELENLEDKEEDSELTDEEKTRLAALRAADSELNNLRKAKAAYDNVESEDWDRLLTWEAREAQKKIEQDYKAIADTFGDIGKTLSSFNSTVGGKNNQLYNQIIYQSFDADNPKQRATDGSNKQPEICSILDSYSWTVDGFKTTSWNTQNDIHKSAPIPHCYLVQYQQLHSSNITNFVNTLVAATSALTDQSTAKSFVSMEHKLSKLYGALQAALLNDNDSKEEQKPAENQGEEGSSTVKNLTTINYSNLLSKVSTAFGGLWNTLKDGSGSIQNAIMESQYLAPYKLLYSLSPTQQRYVFPMITQPPINKLINTYGEKQQGDSLLSNLSVLNWINGVSTGVVNFVRDMKDLTNLMTGSSQTYQLSHVEKAKFYQYPQETQEYTITFPLLNTVKRSKGLPNWKRNYKFLFLFSLKNMVFRRDNASFFPPLIYDLIIPGVIRQPFCYIKEMSVKPLGVVRMMQYSNMLSPTMLGTGGAAYAVAVPQAWIVTIKVKSLIATTANMVMSSLSDLSINTDSVKNVTS